MLVNAPIEYAHAHGIQTGNFRGLAKKLEEIRREIAPEVEKLVDSYETNPQLRSLILDAIPRGAYHRGPFVYVTSSCNGSKPNLPLAAASELVYWADAVLDDIADGNEFRQGATSMRLNAGNELATYVGNVMYGIALEAVADISKDMSKDNARQLFESFARRIHITSRGQGIDLLLTRRPVEDVTIPEYLQLIKETTGVDVGSNMFIGGLSAGLNGGTLESLYQFGLNLGTLAQARDDVLDYCDAIDEHGQFIIGKLPFRDIATGKRRLPLLLTKNPHARRLPDEVYDKIERDTLGPIREEARLHLNSAEIDTDNKQLLEDVLDYWSDIRLFQEIAKGQMPPEGS